MNEEKTNLGKFHLRFNPTSSININNNIKGMQEEVVDTGDEISSLLKEFFDQPIVLYQQEDGSSSTSITKQPNQQSISTLASDENAFNSSMDGGIGSLHTSNNVESTHKSYNDALMGAAASSSLSSTSFDLNSSSFKSEMVKEEERLKQFEYAQPSIQAPTYSTSINAASKPTSALNERVKPERKNVKERGSDKDSASTHSNGTTPPPAAASSGSHSSSGNGSHATKVRRSKEDIEAERLQNENKKLREEIEKLRAQLQQMPQDGDSVSVENALLRQSLMEHRNFIRNCFSLSIPSEKVALRSIGKQGADFAFNHILNTIASSQNGKDWKPVVLPAAYFFSVRPGYSITMSYRIRQDSRGRTMLDIRSDTIAPKIESDLFMDAVWHLTSDQNTLLHLIGAQHPCEFINSSSTFGPEGDDVSDEDDVWGKEQIDFQIYREFDPSPGESFDCALISARTTKDLALSTLLSRPEQIPLMAVIREQHTPLVHSRKVHARKTERRTPTASTHRTLRLGDVPCQIMVRTTTQYSADDSILSSSTNSDVNQSGSSSPFSSSSSTTSSSSSSMGKVSRRVRSFMTAGFVAWDDEAQIEIAFPVIDENGEEQIQLKRDVVNATRMVSIGTVYDDEFRIQGFKGAHSIVNEHGEISQQFAAILESLSLLIHSWCRNHSEPEQESASEIGSVNDASDSKRRKD